MLAELAALPHPVLNAESEVPLYRQLAEQIRLSIASGVLPSGQRLPATRELAGQLGLNRTTVSAAYALLEQSGLLRGEVGRGSFVASVARAAESAGSASEETGAPLVWQKVLNPDEAPVWTTRSASLTATLSFSNSRPPSDAFPLAAFRRLAKEVIDGPEAADILQLGSPYGYEPLRRYLLEVAIAQGIARPGDDLLITNGCQQALDLLSRILVREGTPVILEDPVYHGLLRVFGRAGAQLLPAPVGADGIDPAAVEALSAGGGTRLVLVTPNFQNPTGATLSSEARERLIALAARRGLVLIESDVYSDLRYQGEPLPGLKQLDASGNTILLGSYSKVAFPGLRVGWVIAPRAVIARLADAKQVSDLHSDQLSQAVLLRFAQSGELARHLAATCRDGAHRLRAALDACAACLPPGSQFTRPAGGMNLWVELPAPLEAETLLRITEEQGVSFLPGPFFSARRAHTRSLRLSFGSLTPTEITRGIEIIGRSAREQWIAGYARAAAEPVPALV